MKRILLTITILSLLLTNFAIEPESAEVNFYVKLDGTDANNDKNQSYSTNLYTKSVFTGHVYIESAAYKNDTLTLTDVYDFDEETAIANLKTMLEQYKGVLYTSKNVLATEADLDSIGINWYVFKSKRVNSKPLHVDGQMTGLIVITPTPELTIAPTFTPEPTPTPIIEIVEWSITIFLDGSPKAGLISPIGRELTDAEWLMNVWEDIWTKEGVNYVYISTDIMQEERAISIYYETAKPTITPEPTPTLTPTPEITPTPEPTITPKTPQRDDTPKTGDQTSAIIVKVLLMTMVLCLLALFVIPKKRNK